MKLFYLLSDYYRTLISTKCQRVISFILSHLQTWILVQQQRHRKTCLSCTRLLLLQILLQILQRQQRKVHWLFQKPRKNNFKNLWFEITRNQLRYFFFILLQQGVNISEIIIVCFLTLIFYNLSFIWKNQNKNFWIWY